MAVSTINGILEDSIAGWNGIVAANVTSVGGNEWVQTLPITVDFTANAVSTANQTAYTFSSQAIGDPDAMSGGTRTVVVGTAGLNGSGPNNIVQSIIIGGVYSASQIVATTTARSPDRVVVCSCSFWYNRKYRCHI